MEEKWLPVPGYEGRYEVSNLGRVASYCRGKRKLLALSIDRHGYVAATLCKLKRLWRVRVHTLVLTAFVGPKPEGMECRHLNDDPSDNRLENLVWGTHMENINDMRLLGHLLGPEQKPMAKLTWQDIPVIHELHAQGATHRSIASRFGVAHKTIFQVLHGQSWRLDSPHAIAALGRTTE